ncbi:hypothetical protein KY325_04650, partial [Candidatus Woesearchaeota archaeon]|nr:hypothetical protein [Candidatus Woesearchaeota archaeon]
MEDKQKLKDYDQEIAGLKERYNALYLEKESWAKKKSEISKKISEIISEVKRMKQSRRSYNKLIQDLKKERDVKNAEVKKSIEKIKELEKKKREISKDVKANPMGIKKEISQLNQKIETEVLTMGQEK